MIKLKLIKITLGIIVSALLAIFLVQVNTFSANTPQIPITGPSDTNIIQSARLDLSALPVPQNDLNLLTDNIINTLSDAGINTLFVSPWSDGKANYHESIAKQNLFGKQGFFESLINKAHNADIDVFAWFVVGKDNFAPEQHPEWYAKTITGENLDQEDEPGIFLPMASLANEKYIAYHKALVKEVNQLPIDGWVLSEPLMSWGDRFDDDYADFSESIQNKFILQTGINPKELFNTSSQYYYENNPELYTLWVEFRAQMVTEFVRATMITIRNESNKPIIITLFTEPDEYGNLVSFEHLKEWLGQDINALAKLQPDFFEIQDLFLDFEFPQSAQWTTKMIQQFKKQSNFDIPLMVSVQGFDSVNQTLSSEDFQTAISLAEKENVAGVSFYAYHTLRQEHWNALKKIWTTSHIVPSHNLREVRSERTDRSPDIRRKIRR